jgi:hypothetical protein
MGKTVKLGRGNDATTRPPVIGSRAGGGRVASGRPKLTGEHRAGRVQNQKKKKKSLRKGGRPGRKASRKPTAPPRLLRHARCPGFSRHVLPPDEAGSARTVCPSRPRRLHAPARTELCGLASAQRPPSCFLPLSVLPKILTDHVGPVTTLTVNVFTIRQSTVHVYHEFLLNPQHAYAWSR